MRIPFTALSLLLCTVLSTTAMASETDDAPANRQSAKGEQLYQSCIACHGPSAEGNRAMNAPALSALDSAYITRQLKNFREGLRGSHPGDLYGAQMRAFAMMIADDAAAQTLGSYIAALPDTAAPKTLEGEPKKGEAHYKMICGACHGPKAEGNALLNSPALVGLNDWYLLRQYQNFANGVRGADQKDRYGHQMAMMATALPDEQTLLDVIAYIQSLAE